MCLVDQKCGEIWTRSEFLRDVKSRSSIFLIDLANGGLALSAWIKVSIFREFWFSKCYHFHVSNLFQSIRYCFCDSWYLSRYIFTRLSFSLCFGSDECGIGCRPHSGRISSFLCFVFPCKNIIERHNDVNNKEIEAFDPFETINIKL